MLKKVLVLFVFTIVLNSCGDCPDDCCIGDPCFAAGAGGGYVFETGDFEVSEEALECATNKQEIQNKFALLIEEAGELFNLEIETLSAENEGFWDDYDARIDELKVSFESEGGNLEVLEEKIFQWYEEMQIKIDELAESSDIESQEWRDATRLLDLELVEGIVKLFSEGSSESESQASQFLDWFKENKQKFDEVEDKIINALLAYDIEVEGLVNERDEEIAALNCG